MAIQPPPYGTAYGTTRRADNYEAVAASGAQPAPQSLPSAIDELADALGLIQSAAMDLEKALDSVSCAYPSSPDVASRTLPDNASHLCCRTLALAEAARNLAAFLRRVHQNLNL